MMNYHELTMNEARDSPQRRKQFLVISAIGVIMALHSSITAGAFETLSIEQGTFTGGEFVHKYMTKDYAAATGALRTVASDLGIYEGDLTVEDIKKDKKGNDLIKLDSTADLLFSILLDDAGLVPGGKTRFASGVLLPGKSSSDMKKRLLEVNKGITKEGGTHSTDVKYQVGSLPKVNAAMASHPFTAGAFSAMLQSFKIIPKFKKYAEDHGESGKSPVIIATCSAKQKMCTYYMPLSKRDKFYMGNPTTEVYAKDFESLGWLGQLGLEFDGSDTSIGGINLGSVFRGMKKALGLGGSSTKSASDGDEL